MLTLSTGYALLRTELNIGGLTILEPIIDEEDNTKVCKAAVETTVVSSWNGTNYSLNIKIKNNSNENYYSWQIRFTGNGSETLTTGDAKVTTSNGNIYLTNLSYNGEIDSNKELTISVNLSTTMNIDEFRESLVVVACGRSSDQENTITHGGATLVLGQTEKELQAVITLKTAGIWGGGYNEYNIKITNNTDIKTSSWRGVIYYGKNAKLSSIYPCLNTDDPTTHTVSIANNASADGAMDIGGSSEYTLILQTNDTTYIPDIVVAGLKALN